MPAAERKVPSAAPVADAAAPASVAMPSTAAPAPSGGNDLLDLLGDSGPSQPAAQQAPPAASGGGLSDLLGLDLGGGSAPASQQPPMPAMGGGLMDLLGGDMGMSAAPSGGGGLMDLLGGAPTPAPVQQTAAPESTMDLLGGLLGGPTSAPALVAAATPSAPAGGIPSITAWEKNGLLVRFDFSKNPSMPNVLQILLTATNSTPAPMQNFLFQLAVPTNMQLQLQAQSASVVPPMNGGPVTQRIMVNNPQQVAIRMRCKISYQGGMGPVEDMGEVANFPLNAK